MLFLNTGVHLSLDEINFDLCLQGQRIRVGKFPVENNAKTIGSFLFCSSKNNINSK